MSDDNMPGNLPFVVRPTWGGLIQDQAIALLFPLFLLVAALVLNLKSPDSIGLVWAVLFVGVIFAVRVVRLIREKSDGPIMAIGSTGLWHNSQVVGKVWLPWEAIDEVIASGKPNASMLTINIKRIDDDGGDPVEAFRKAIASQHFIDVGLGDKPYNRVVDELRSQSQGRCIIVLVDAVPIEEDSD